MKLRPLHPPHGAGKINVTPLIDVVMVLIVFYLIVGRLATERLTPVRLPESRAGDAQREEDATIISVAQVPGNAAGTRIVVNGTLVGPDELRTALRARAPADAPVRLRADRDLPFSTIAPVLDACRDAGITTLRLVADRAPPGARPGGSP